ncbi:zinc finger protein ZFP2-like [Daphnia carinata]|uniref:zinc finger protein ZFP2-like n=1 Tax=Daphnia carinata TaxID=120202 RepID=UPI00257B70F0|nr:zinc finger protein ZFP2-like [Daphnia carinata]
MMCTSASSNLRDFENSEGELYLKICKTFQDDAIDFLKEARKNAIKTDVFFLANDDTQDSLTASLSAHKEVLAAASPYLAEILETSYDSDVYISFSGFKKNHLKLLLDYIYSGEICASHALMEEFEFCLKELGILGTHSLVCSDEIITTKPAEAILFKNSVQQPFDLQNSPIQTNLTSKDIASENTMVLESRKKKTPSNQSDSENDISEEQVESCANKTISGDRPYVCPVCQKSFRHLNVLRTHSRVHTGEKPFSCSTCNRAFSHKSTLNEHMNLHSDDRPYACDKCQRRFKQRKSLRAHRCEILEEEIFHCEVCKRNFVNRKALALHRIHHDNGSKKKLSQEKPFLCDICARGFSNKYLLKAHQMTHVEEKSFECNICHKKFSLKKTLQVHEASHKRENKIPYQCSFCTKSFRYLANLNAHELIHTGQKPFDCNKCGVAFRQKWSLKEHMLVHDKPDGDRPFTCDICNKSFQARRKFVAHRYSHSKQTKRCPVCKKRFYNAERLATHIMEHENVDDLPVSDAIGNTVTAHMNDDGELIITQDVDEIGEGTLIFTPSLLHVIKSTDENCDGMESTEGQDEANRWSLEVVIEPDLNNHHQTC